MADRLSRSVSETGCLLVRPASSQRLPARSAAEERRATYLQTRANRTRMAVKPAGGRKPVDRIDASNTLHTGERAACHRSVTEVVTLRLLASSSGGYRGSYRTGRWRDDGD